MSNAPIELPRANSPHPSPPPNGTTPPVPSASLMANFGALASSHAIGLVVPLLTVPYLARVLRPEGWAPVIVAQALAAWVVLLLDYGFDLSGTRSVAVARARTSDMADVVWGVQSAKLLLVPVALLILLGTSAALPALRHAPMLVGWTCLFALTRGLSPLWYFQGLERVRAALAIDTAAKVLGALGVFLVVRDPSHGWRVLALQAGCSAVSVLLLTGKLWREVRPRSVTFDGAVRTLRLSWTLFAFRASSTLYLQANTLLLGLFAPTAAVAAYGGAERLVRASINLLEPLTRTLLPRLSFLSAAHPERAVRLIRQSLLGLGTAGGVMGALLALAAPTVVALLLGPGYEDAVPVLRVLALLVPIIAVGTVLGLFWALPFGRDRVLLLVTATAGLVNVALVVVLVPRMAAPGMAALGMASAVVTAELLVAVTLGVLYARWHPEFTVDTLVAA